MTHPARIRNFCIIAHIDHGKSTLADRLLECTGTLSSKQMRAQVLDDMDLERERGITIKAHPIRMEYTGRNGQSYSLNLIDTPGHVDFSYEVSRSLAACEGAILVVDASQGIEAQTLSNLYLALEHDLQIIPVLNKIDLPAADVEGVTAQVTALIGCEPEDILSVSAKEGTGCDAVLEAVVDRIPAPTGDPEKPLRALVFDSEYNQFRGALAYVRVVDGCLSRERRFRFFSGDRDHQPEEVGYFRLEIEPQKSLGPGEVGYVLAGIKNIREVLVGDTLVDPERPAEALPGYRPAKSMVFSGIYPSDSDRYPDLREALEKLQLNDASLSFEPETSDALGFGFRCGFLGLLHMEIIQERLDREHGLDIVTTMPNVLYRGIMNDGSVRTVDNPAQMPEPKDLDHLEEPIVRASVIVPSEYIGTVMKLLQERRGLYETMSYLDPTRAELHYELPLAEIIFDFYDRLKSVSRGYASFDYEFAEYRASKLVKLDMLLNGVAVDALSMVIHQDKAYDWGRKVAEKLSTLIPRQLYEVVIQAAIGSRVIAREVIRPLRKNVTAKCYGGDVSRKRKLLERQKEGKKRMKQVGRVEIPQEAFHAVLQVDS